MFWFREFISVVLNYLILITELCGVQFDELIQILEILPSLKTGQIMKIEMDF